MECGKVGCCQVLKPAGPEIYPNEGSSKIDREIHIKILLHNTTIYLSDFVVFLHKSTILCGVIFLLNLARF